MNVNVARKLDSTVGVIFSFVINLFINFGKLFLFLQPKVQKIPKKILFLELSEMGAAILSYSAIKKAKDLFPNAQIYFWIFKENAESVKVLNIIDEKNLICMRSKNLWVLFIDTFKNLNRIRSEKIDVIIDMELFSRFTSILCFLSAVKIKVGFYKFALEGLYRVNTYTHKVMYNPYLHISKNFLALVYAMLNPKVDSLLLKKNLELEKTEVIKKTTNLQELEKIWQKINKENEIVKKEDKLVIINLGINEYLPLRRWPTAYYVDLIKNLIQNDNVFVVLVGVKYSLEKEIVPNEILNNKKCINLIGKTNLSEVIDLCNVANLLISHDSGVINLASLSSVNTIVMFGPETPDLYAPLNSNKTIIYKRLACSPCYSAYNHRLSMCDNNLCLKEISPEEVYQKALEYLKKS